MKRGRAVPALAALAILLLPAVPAAAFAQQEEDLTTELKSMRAAYDVARAKLDDLDFAGAVKALGAVIEPRRTARPRDLGAEELSLLVAACDMRARAQFNLGNTKAAEADYETLLRFQPSYAIDRQTLSPKVVTLFDAVRARVAGILYLDLDPPRARVRVDGETVEPGGPAGLALLAGNRVLKIESDGYDPQEATIAVVAGAEMRRTVHLRPNRRTLQFITAPYDVAVVFDGQPAGTTTGPGGGDVVALAPQYNLDPSTLSSPFLLPMVTPGDHTVTFQRECYRPQTLTVKVALDLEKNAPQRFAPVVLQEARTDLRLTSTPPGAEVTVDGERKGTTPLTIAALCGGERDVVVSRPDAGAWSERIRLTPGQTNVLDVRLRPTLLYAGTFRLDEWGRAVWSDEDKALLEEINRGLKTLNLVRSEDVLKRTREAAIKWMITQPAEVRAGAILPPALLEAAAKDARADLVLAGLTLGGDDKSWTLALYSVLHPTPDVVVLRTDQPDAARDFVKRLDSAPPASGSWLGMGVVDSQYEIPGGAANPGPLVARVIAGSPAAKAGLKAGDRIRAVGSAKIRDTRDLYRAVAADTARPGGLRGTVVLAVDDVPSPRTVRVAPEDTPIVVPLRDPALLYNRALAEFRLRSRAAQEDGERGVALLNLGVAYMHFRAYDRAQSEGFARAALPPGPGISEGTVLYYRGLCALRRGDPAAAKTAFTAAAAATGATLDSGDGPSAAAAAARMLQSLE